MSGPEGPWMGLVGLPAAESDLQAVAPAPAAFEDCQVLGRAQTVQQGQAYNVLGQPAPLAGSKLNRPGHSHLSSKQPGRTSSRSHFLATGHTLGRSSSISISLFGSSRSYPVSL